MKIVERLREYDKREDWSYVRHPDVCIEAADEIEKLQSIIREIVSQIDQGGENGKVFARDNCIQRAREVL